MADSKPRKPATRTRRPAKDSKAATPTPAELRRADLVDLRSRLIRALDLGGPRELPALSRELRLVDAELAEIAPAEEDSTTDELKRRREARRERAAAAPRSAAGRK